MLPTYEKCQKRTIEKNLFCPLLNSIRAVKTISQTFFEKEHPLALANLNLSLKLQIKQVKIIIQMNWQ